MTKSKKKVDEIYDNLPKVDDGTIYSDIVKFIIDHNFTISIDDQLTMIDLQALVPDHNFEKVAECKLNIAEYFPSNKRLYLTEGSEFDGKLVDYQVGTKFKKKWDEVEKEWVYTIVYNGRVLKIGMTSSGLKSRFGSYNTGTKKAMIKGSCATTNFVITQCNYLALLKNIKVEVFAYEIPSVWTTQIIFGRETQVLNKVAHKYESVLIDIYKQATGKIPFLCGQS